MANDIVNQIISGIAKRLKESFGDIKVHGDYIEQGFTGPCFFVDELRTADKPLLGTRRKCDLSFDVHYFPEDENDRGELYSAGERMKECLRFVSLPDGPIRGRQIQTQAIDGVMHCMVDYNIILQEPDNLDPMDGYEIQIRGPQGGN